MIISAEFENPDYGIQEVSGSIPLISTNGKGLFSRENKPFLFAIRRYVRAVSPVCKVGVHRERPLFCQ